MPKPTYNRLAFDYGHKGEALQEIVAGRETRILDLDGNPITLPAEYGCSVAEADVATPAWAPDYSDPAPTVTLPEPPPGFSYVLAEQ